MLKLVDGKRSVEELVALSGLGEFQAMSGLASLARANAITAAGPLPAPPAGSGPAPVARSLRRPAPPAWLPLAVWGGAGLCLLLAFGLFRWEPLGLVPASSAQRRALDELRSLRARGEMGELVRRVEEYTARQGSPPVSLESLARVGGRVPLRDPWGHPYRLGDAGSRGLVLSAGPDRRADTADDLAAGGA
jgi:hypothetical protein